MDVSIFVESWREGIKHSMRKEKFLKKALVSVGGLVTLVSCSLIGAYWMSYWTNVLHVQDIPALAQKYNETNRKGDPVTQQYFNQTYYDINWINGSYNDEAESLTLLKSLNDTYGGNDWMMQGS